MIKRSPVIEERDTHKKSSGVIIQTYAAVRKRSTQGHIVGPGENIYEQPWSGLMIQVTAAYA